MQEQDNLIQRLYQQDEYIIKNPSLHEEDTPWKVGKIIPLTDAIDCLDRSAVTVLDVGGGAGLILKAISTHIESNREAKVRRFALDLSPGMLQVQKTNNPSLEKALNEDICKTSLTDKEIDVTLMIDVLEHIPNATQALEELKRISRFVILKVPLEDNLAGRLLNLITGGKRKRNLREALGHVSCYDFNSLKRQVEGHAGEIIVWSFCNVFQYYRHSAYYKKRVNMQDRLVGYVGGFVFAVSPRLCSLMFTDFVMVLVKCG